MAAPSCTSAGSWTSCATAVTAPNAFLSVGRLEETASAEGVADRLTFTGPIDESALVDLYAGAAAVVFPPYDEEYGYVTLEAFLARKPFVTTSDAGGPLEFVDDGVIERLIEAGSR